MQLHNTEITLKGRLFPFFGLWDIFAKRKGDIIVFCMTCKATQIGGEGPFFAPFLPMSTHANGNEAILIVHIYIQGTEKTSYSAIKK